MRLKHVDFEDMKSVLSAFTLADAVALFSRIAPEYNSEMIFYVPFQKWMEFQKIVLDSSVWYQSISDIGPMTCLTGPPSQRLWREVSASNYVADCLLHIANEKGTGYVIEAIKQIFKVGTP